VWSVVKKEQQLLMSYIHSDVWIKIAEHVGFRRKLILRGLCTAIRKKIQIRSIPFKYQSLLNDNILSLFPHLIILDVTNESKITSNGLRNVPNLLILNANGSDSITSLEYVSKLNALSASSEIHKNCTISSETLIFVPDLKLLFASFNENICDLGLQYVPKLEKLYVQGNRKITSQGLRFVPHLKELDARKPSGICDEGLRFVPKLEKLLFDHTKITTKGLKCLSNLTQLIVQDNINITSEALSHLSNLLILQANGIGDEELKYVPKLVELRGHNHFSSSGLHFVPNLQVLQADNNPNVISLHGVPKLRTLDACKNCGVTSNELKDVPLLQKLSIYGNDKITWEGLLLLHNLKSVCLFGGQNASSLRKNLSKTHPHVKLEII
jgi:hypothetical protein